MQINNLNHIKPDKELEISIMKICNETSGEKLGLKEIFIKKSPNHNHIYSFSPTESDLSTRYIEVPAEAKPGWVRRMFNKVGLFYLKPQFTTVPRPSDEVMDAFAKHDFSDSDTAGLVQKLKDAGIKTDDALIEIANEITLYTEEVEAALRELKSTNGRLLAIA